MATLQERVAEAVERERLLKLHRDSAHLIRLLLNAGVIDRLPSVDEIKVHKYGREQQVRYDLDGVAFTVFVNYQTQYGDDGEPIGDKEYTRLRAQRICSVEGCDRLLQYPYADPIEKLSDIERLFVEAERSGYRGDCGLGDRHGQPHGMEIDGIEDNDLEDLPF